MTLHLTHTFHDALELSADDAPLFRYVYEPNTPQLESPRPFFHPVHSLAGDLVTVFRPYDHIWHKGISMTIAHLEDQNFWGGGSYRHGQGYVQLPNNGRQRHDAWSFIECDGASFAAQEQLTWITQAGEAWIAETRTIGVQELDPAAGYWSLDFAASLVNVRGAPLHIGSPTTAGRPMAGYGGLFWRGPRSFLQGDAFNAAGQEGPACMGQPAAWLAYVGRHDGSANASTLIFLDHPSNVRYPTKWFMRQVPFACASFAFMFDEVYVLEPDARLDLRYRIVVANGPWDRDAIEPLAQAWQEG